MLNLLRVRQMNINANTKTRKTILISIFSLLLLLIAFRIYLPTLLLHFVNNKLNEIPGYESRIDRISVKLWRGAFQINGLKTLKSNRNTPVPYFSADIIDISIEWKALLHGSIAGAVSIHNPSLNIVNEPAEQQKQPKIDKSMTTTTPIKKPTPFKIDRLEIKNGSIHFIDPNKKPGVDIRLSEINAVVANLTNESVRGELLPAEITARAKCFESGNLLFHGRFAPFAVYPTFKIEQTINSVELKYLSDFFDAYAKLRLKSGVFELYTEIAAKDGSYKGYTKPFLKDLAVEKSAVSTKPVLKKMWSYIASAAIDILSNKKEQVAARVDFSGSIGKTADIDLIGTIGSLLSNAFIQGLIPAIDNSINIYDVKPSPGKQQKGKK